MKMRIRFAELLEEHNVKHPKDQLSAYKVAQRSSGRIALTSAYRLQRGGGGLPRKLSELLDALGEVFGVSPERLLGAGPSRDERPPSTPSTPTRLRLAEIRTARHLTQLQLAQLAGVRQAAISDIESGKRKRLDLDILERLAVALGVEPGEMFETAPKRKSDPARLMK